MNTPILFIVFNRLKVTKRVFERIKSIKPLKLYISSDGERNELEKIKVEEVRQYLLKNIDWECKVETKFNSKNLGCKNAVSSAIDWFFKLEEKGIILEDDCLPSKSFFSYCEKLLDKYEKDLRVWHIGGYKHPYLTHDKFSYNFSKYTMIWGWATWRNRWKFYDKKLVLFEKEKEKLFSNYSFFDSKDSNLIRIEILNKVKKEIINTWDYQWNFTVRINNGLSIRPTKNLVRNIGFDNDATHTIADHDYLSSNFENDIVFPLSHPDRIMVYKKNDQIFEKKNFKISYLHILKKYLYELFKT